MHLVSLENHTQDRANRVISRSKVEKSTQKMEAKKGGQKMEPEILRICSSACQDTFSCHSDTD